jgi:hypothetical protein
MFLKANFDKETISYIRKSSLYKDNFLDSSSKTIVPINNLVRWKYDDYYTN